VLLSPPNQPPHNAPTLPHNTTHPTPTIQQQTPTPQHAPTQALSAAGVKFRILVTGPVVEAPATGFVRLNDTEFLLPNATITRGDLSRIATEFFLVAGEKQDATQIYGQSVSQSVSCFVLFVFLFCLALFFFGGGGNSGMSS
jgi:hypothetical protein